MVKHHIRKILLLMVFIFLIISLRANLRIESLTIGSDNNGNWWWEAELKNDGSPISINMVKTRAVQLPNGPVSEWIIKEPFTHNGTVTVRRGLTRRYNDPSPKAEILEGTSCLY